MTKRDISVATVFGEEVEKQWHGHVPRECVFQLRLMAEQIMTLEKMIQTQQNIIEKLMQFAVVEGNALKLIQEANARIEKLGNSMTDTEHLDD